jgi:hypothetical protein
MNKSESKLFSQWPRHHNRGMTIFILRHGIALLTIPFVGVSFLCRLFVFHRHPMRWDDIVYVSVAGLAVGIIRGVIVWHKMERFYGAQPK